MENVKLRVMEALQEDAYKGIARIDIDTMKRVGVRRGDVIKIKGNRETVVIVDRAYPADVGENVIRIDGIIRRNARTGIGETVLVEKVDVKEAKKVVIAPAQKGIQVKGDPESVKQSLLGRAIIKGDIVVLGGTQRRRDVMSGMEFFDDIFAEAFGGMGGFGFSGISQIRFAIVSTSPSQAVVITESTELVLHSEAVEVTEEKVIEVTYEDIGGLDEEIKKIREMVELPLKHPEIFIKLGIEPPKGILMYGPPGTGKTLLAKAVANESEANFILINGPEVMSKFYGESEKNLRDKFEEAEKSAPSIIFIDEIDALAPKREESYGEVERRVVSQLLTMMDGLKGRGKVVVIGATNMPNILDPALRRPGRFDREISINVPDKAGRLSILKIHTRNMPLEPPLNKSYIQRKINISKESLDTLNSELKNNKEESKIKEVNNEIKHHKEFLSRLEKYLNLLNNDEAKNRSIIKELSSNEKDELNSVFIGGMMEDIAAITHGFVGADVAALCKEAAMAVLRKVLPELNMKEDEEIPKEILEKLVVTQKDFFDALRTVRPSAMREVLVEKPNVKWGDAGGLEKVKQELKEAVEWPLKYPDSFKRVGIRPPRGILLYGPPGTGKTLLAKAVANESEANFIQVKGPSLLSMWVGKSLPYDEEIIVMKDGIVERVPIGRLVEGKENAHVISFDKNKKTKFSPIKDFVKHNPESGIVEIKTTTGRKIRVTKDHSLFSIYGTEIIDLPTTHLKENESYIAIPKKITFPETLPEKINILKVLNENIYVVYNDYIENAIKKLGKDKSSKILGIREKYVYDVLSKKLPVKAKEFLSLTKEAGINIDFEKININYKNSIHKMPALLNISPELCELLGLWIAEGDYNKNSTRIHNKDKEIRSRIAKLLDNLNLPYSITENAFSIDSLLFQKIMKDVFKLNQGSGKKRVPAIGFTLPKNYVMSFLRGYCSGDGSAYTTNSRNLAIEMATKSESLANDLLYLMLGFGIVSRVYDKVINGCKYYRVMFMGVDNLKEFSKIGFIDKKRNDQVFNYIKNKKWGRTDNIPITGELASLIPKSRKGNVSIERAELKKIGEKIKNEKVLELVNSEIYFDKVVSIKEISCLMPVYDLTINPSENFVAGFGGVFVHNSEEGARKIFERARQVAPCIIFFDEIDALASRRGLDLGNKVTERVLNQILAEMDGLEELQNVVVIGATNRPDMLDPALLRPGRFDRIIATTIPNKEGRLEIFKIHTKGMPLTKDISLNALAEKTENFTGADIEAFCREAAMLALREDIKAKEVKKKHFEEALKKVSASVAEEDVKKYKEIETKYLRSAKAALERMPRAEYFG